MSEHVSPTSTIVKEIENYLVENPFQIEEGLTILARLRVGRVYGLVDLKAGSGHGRKDE